LSNALNADYVAIVKRDCPTCQLVVPALQELVVAGRLIVWSQDDPAFPEALGGARDDRSLERSHQYGIDIVPTLLKFEGGREVGRTEGWNQVDWRALTGLDRLGEALVSAQPGCGSLSVEPGIPERLALRFGGLQFQSRAIDVDEMEDPIEVSFDRGWSDGLPVVPPTELRVARMLTGTSRRAEELVGRIPPNLVECSVEKVAINAVMAGCRPEYMPVVLAAVEAALDERFSMHGLLCTLWFSGPAIIVNGPVARRIGMNGKGNALGQGNRANATIGRTLQLIVRNVGGGFPGEIDRAVLGHPGKYTFCFAEDESDPEWTPLHVSRGHARESSTVTLFHADGVQGVSAQAARGAEELSRSLAMALAAVGHPKMAAHNGAMLVLSPDHFEIYKAEGYGRGEVEASLRAALRRPGKELVRGAQGVAEGIAPERRDELIDKFSEAYPLVVRAGGRGGLLSAVIGGWSAQRRASEVQVVSKEIEQ